MEVDISLAHGQVAVAVTMVVVEVDLTQLCYQCRQPVHQRCSRETVLVSHIQTEAQVRGW
jgi:hypothetical protein